ncbi:MAG: hypothetical protein IT223_07785 [Crocinitomicaceae bacterium]|nr:hypothetical protein [Crocinitomicaceae bacterium]
MKNVFFCLGLIFVTGTGMKIQVPAETDINIFYIDNSRVVLEDGLSTGQKEALDRDTKEAFEKGSVVAFLSNGNQSVLATESKDCSALIEDLYRRNTERPDFSSDKFILRNALYAKLKKFTGKLQFHFFLSDESILDISRGNVTLTNFFPKELAAIADNVNSIEVEITYSNRTGKVKKNKLEEAIGFYNTQEFAPVIVYTINHIQ